MSDYVEKLRNGEIISDEFEKDCFKHICYQTVKRIFIDSKIKVEFREYKKPHPLRNYDIACGFLQFDPKIIGALDNKFGIDLYIVDMIDERTGIPFGKLSTKMPKEFLIETLESGIAFYKNLFAIHRTRTDHQLSFKRTEMIGTGLFNATLSKHGILHEYSILGESETNGKIERHHRTIDNEVLWLINSSNGVEEAIGKYDKWIARYPYERYTTYKIWDHKIHKWKLVKMKPIEAINYKFY